VVRKIPSSGFQRIATLRYILIALLDGLGFIFLNIADFKDVRAG